VVEVEEPDDIAPADQDVAGVAVSVGELRWQIVHSGPELFLDGRDQGRQLGEPGKGLVQDLPSGIVHE